MKNKKYLVFQDSFQDVVTRPMFVVQTMTDHFVWGSFQWEILKWNEISWFIKKLFIYLIKTDFSLIFEAMIVKKLLYETSVSDVSEWDACEYVSQNCYYIFYVSKLAHVKKKGSMWVSEMLANVFRKSNFNIFKFRAWLMLKKEFNVSDACKCFTKLPLYFFMSQNWLSLSLSLSLSLHLFYCGYINYFYAFQQLFTLSFNVRLRLGLEESPHDWLG